MTYYLVSIDEEKRKLMFWYEAYCLTKKKFAPSEYLGQRVPVYKSLDDAHRDIKLIKKEYDDIIVLPIDCGLILKQFTQDIYDDVSVLFKNVRIAHRIKEHLS